MIADVIEEDTMSDEIYAEEALPMSYAAVLSDTPAAPGTPVDVVFLLQSAGTREFDFNTQRTMIKDVMCMLQRSHGKENIRVCVIAFDTLGATIISPDTWFTDSDELQTALSELTYSSKGWSVADRGAAFSKLIFEVEFKKTASKFVFHLVNGLSTVGSGYPDQLAACSQLPINYSELVVEEYRSGSPQYMEEVAKAIAKTNGINLPFNPGTSTATVYNHICEYTAATPLPITEYMVTIANSWKKITLDDVLDPDSDTDTDEDGLRDWDEVNIELIPFDSNGSPKLPTFGEIISWADRIYADIGISRLNSSSLYPSTGDSLLDDLYQDLYVLPIISDPTEVDGDGDGYDDFYETNISKTSSLKSDVKKYELLHDYTSIVELDGTPSFGGDQSWSSGQGRPYDFKDDLRSMGCGVIASCDILLYLQKTRNIAEISNTKFNKDGTIKMDDYLDFVEDYYTLYRSTMLGTISPSWNQTTAKGLNTYFNTFYDSYRVRLINSKSCAKSKSDLRFRYSWIDDSYNGFINIICNSLEDDIPFILSATNFIPQKKGISMYSGLLTGSNENMNKLDNIYGVKLREHAVTITGIIDDRIKDDAIIIFSSWHRKFFISYKELKEKTPNYFDLYGIEIFNPTK